MNRQVVLLIEDEEQIQTVLSITLESNNYHVVKAATAKEGLMQAATQDPDLILLDLGLPDQHGHDVLVHLREWYKKPIIILSAQHSQESIINALNNGANDYITKPYRSPELMSRIRSAIHASQSELKEATFDNNGLVIDFASRRVRRNNQEVRLTTTEYNMLLLFVKNEGKVLTHQYVADQVFGAVEDAELQNMRVQIAQLRKKIEVDPNRPAYIITEPGVGYRFMSSIQ